MTCCTTDQTAKYISAAFVCRHDTIGYHKCCGTDMVCDQTDGYVIIVVLFIFFAGNLAYKITQGADGIYIKDRIYILNNNCQTFQSHTCIDILLFQGCIVSVTIVLKLGKYIVPYFHITVAVAAYCTAWFTAAIFFSTIIVDFRTWTAWTCAVLPEVVFFSETEDSVSRDSDFFVPDIECFIILLINRRIKTVCVQSNYFCQEFP